MSFKRRVILTLFLLFFVFNNRLIALDIDDLVKIEPLIKNNQILVGLSLSLLKVILSGFQLEKINYFLKIYSLFSPKTFLVVQDYRFSRKNVKKKFLKVFVPLNRYNQKVFWQAAFLNSKKLEFNSAENCYLFEHDSNELKLSVCSIVKTSFVKNENNVFFSQNISRNSFTKGISNGIKSLYNIYEFLLDYGTYSVNNRVIPIQYILINPFNLDCTEFSTIVLEILLDKGLDPNYVLGLSVSNSKRNYFEKHCWVSFNVDRQAFAIDSALGRKIGKVAYGSHLPTGIIFSEVKKLNSLCFFPLEIFDENNVEILKNVDYTEKIMVYELQKGKFQ